MENYTYNHRLNMKMISNWELGIRKNRGNFFNDTRHTKRERKISFHFIFEMSVFTVYSSRNNNVFQ